MALIIYKHVKNKKSTPREFEVSPSLRASMSVNSNASGRRPPRPIRRAGMSIPTIVPVSSTPVALASSLQKNNGPSGIELNLSARSDSITLNVEPDPAGYWEVEEETRHFWESV